MADEIKNNEPGFIFLGFADNKRPEFKEVRNKDYILFGEDNKFPDHILYLFDKSSVHSAIINNKVKYIMGNGIDITKSPAVPNQISLTKINRYGESINKVLEKSCKDIELFGGFYWQVVYDALGRIKEILHTPFQTIRKGKEKGWFHCKKWSDSRLNKDPKFIEYFDIDAPVKTVQLFAYKEYRPGDQEYPLPGYFAALNDLETDAEISIYNLSVMKNGQFTGKLITFFGGKVIDEVKRNIERDWKKKFNGSGNAGTTMLSFQNGTDKEPNVQDLSSTDLDKLFDQLRKSTEGKILAGHEVTTPVLFGIKDSGTSLSGDGTTLEMGYNIFRTTYANAKQKNIEEVLEVFLPLIGQPVQKIIPVDLLPNTTPGATQPGMTNENLKNMTGRQYQNMDRIIRRYRNKKLDKAAAALLLKKSFDLGDEDIETMLSDKEDFSKDFTEEEVAEMFASCGQAREHFEIVRSKRFSKDDEEMIFADVKGNDSAIIDLIRKDKRITPEIIAQTLDVTKSYVEKRIEILSERGVLKQTTEKVGEGWERELYPTIIREVVPEIIDKIDKPETVDVFIRYSYEVKPGVGPELIPTSRPFCKRLIELDRLYSRAEIETITQRVGFSVWDRKGGWWGESPECRHEWKRNVVLKKRKA